MAASMPPMEQSAPGVPANFVGLQSQQVFERNATQPVFEDPATLAAHPAQNHPPPPAKRSRTGATRMRPSKTSVTPR